MVSMSSMFALTADRASATNFSVMFLLDEYESEESMLSVEFLFHPLPDIIYGYIHLMLNYAVFYMFYLYDCCCYNLSTNVLLYFYLLYFHTH